MITSVNRDDFPMAAPPTGPRQSDRYGYSIRNVKFEVLIPDFNGDEAALNVVLDAEPDVFNHNTETVARLYRRVRPTPVMSSP